MFKWEVLICLGVSKVEKACWSQLALALVLILLLVLILMQILIVPLVLILLLVPALMLLLSLLVQLVVLLVLLLGKSFPGNRFFNQMFLTGVRFQADSFRA
jgi:hypothetical protein